MAFRSYDSLHVFDLAARHLSFTAAAAELNLTKGAVSYQIARLEDELGFKLFTRHHRQIRLTDRGHRLWRAARQAFADVDKEIAGLRRELSGSLTVGVSTYFASRWLSPRLMRFIAMSPGIALRLQPLVDLIDLASVNVDLAIRWGRGDWDDLMVEPLFVCPAFPTAGHEIAERLRHAPFEDMWPNLPLLHDRDGSMAWTDWHEAAGLPWPGGSSGLVIPDPNVRVQAVIDGQGVALNDELVQAEIDTGRLFRVTDVELADYGYYLVYPAGNADTGPIKRFRDWILEEAAGDLPA